MSFLQTCSWCRQENGVSNMAVFCTGCGHRADVSRMDCDCETCLPPPRILEREPVPEIVDRLRLPLPPKC